MKRFIAIWVLLGFFIADTGLTFSTHYCQGHAVDHHMGLTQGDVGCGMERSKGECEAPQQQLRHHCCEDEHNTFSIEEEYAPSSFSFTQDLLPLTVLAIVELVWPGQEKKDDRDLPKNASPPALASLELPVLYQVFRL